MTRDHLTWGQRRLANAWRLTRGLRVSPRTVHKYMPSGCPQLPRPTREGPALAYLHAQSRVGPHRPWRGLRSRAGMCTPCSRSNHSFSGGEAQPRERVAEGDMSDMPFPAEPYRVGTGSVVVQSSWRGSAWTSEVRPIGAVLPPDFGIATAATSVDRLDVCPVVLRLSGGSWLTLTGGAPEPWQG